MFYPDTILFIVAGISFVIVLLLMVFLLLTKKRGQIYRTILKQDTQTLDALSSTLKMSLISSRSSTNDSTELLKRANTSIMGSELDDTEPMNSSMKTAIRDIHHDTLSEKYEIIKEIQGGAMSTIFLARNNKLGNLWIIKYIDAKLGFLAEEEILKLLNHISLPKIVDIIHTEHGVYLVESYIEGIPLNSLLNEQPGLSQSIVLEWAEQLAQVLSYLHSLEPHSILHLDLKPSNIMLTHNNRLVVIDFGISKRQNEKLTDVIAVTYTYAAPEQLRDKIPEKHIKLINERFGVLPEERTKWKLDARTDIYSLGVILFEMAVGSIPTINNLEKLYQYVSEEMAFIVLKCIAVDPKDRFQSAEELLIALNTLKSSRVKMDRTLLYRKIAMAGAIVAFLLSGSSLASGAYIHQQERSALLSMDPAVVIVSRQQSAEIKIDKRSLNGKVTPFDGSQMRWSASHDNVAQVEGNKVFGLNVGDTELNGSYRNKSIHVKVKVVEPMNGMVEISQRFQLGRTIGVWAGSLEREHHDGPLPEADFVSPESMSVTEDGTIYLCDSGIIREIKEGVVESIELDPDFLVPHLVKYYQDNLYILTDPWEEDGEKYYGIIRMNDEGAEGLLIAEAAYTAIEDFAFTREGQMIFIDRNAGMEQVYLKTLNLENSEDIRTLCVLPDGTSALTLDDQGAVYLANPILGTIQMYKEGKLSNIAGLENQKAFIDGDAPLFYEPQRIHYSSGALYIWDFNVLRKLSIENNVALNCITVAGEASPEFNMDISPAKAEDIVLPNSKLMDFAVLDNSILITDPKRGIVWEME